MTTDAGGGSDTSVGPTDDAGTCGDGIVGGTEQCDDGAKNGATGDPCTSSCAWVCIKGDPMQGDPACNTSSNPCLGMATCQANHTCLAGTPLTPGASCGTGLICSGGTCNAILCGDGIVSTGEECDDGAKNGSPSDGCTKSCKFVCVSADPARNCAPADPCAGKGTCDDTKHTCSAGTPLGDGTICGGESPDGGSPDGGPIDVCKGGTCVAGFCGDGVLEPGEDCDFGTANAAGSGCEANCKFSCATLGTTSCTQPADSCAGQNTCTAVVVNGDTGRHCVQGAPLGNNTACGNSGKCQSGVCVTATCGNGVLDPGEQCDFGSGKNITGSGCEPDCTYSCTTTATAGSKQACQTNTCAATPTVCTVVPAVTGSTQGQKCEATPELAACADCSGTGVCVSNQCATSHCGDGCVDPRIGETCEPPNTATCDATCHTIAAAVCGNSKRETGEQCDDGNTANLDGCDSKCQFEQDHRANSVAINGTTDTFCAANALGKKAISALALGVLNGDLTTGVKAGTTTIAFKFYIPAGSGGSFDLAGVTPSSGLLLGSLAGLPVTGTGYDGTKDTDWWYTTTGATIDANRNPLSTLAASLAATKLTATGTIDLAVAITGAATTLHVTGASLAATVGPTTAPTVSTGATPGHLASENLDPALTSFATMSSGQLCGNASAASLANFPMPTPLIGALCGNKYTAANFLLDALVGGCGIFITATQPDQVDPSVPPAGAGPGPTGYTLVETANAVTSCKDKSGTVFTKPSAAFTACLNAAAYSSYFNFTSDRVIMK